MMTIENEISRTDKLVRRVMAGTPPQPEEVPKKEPIDWRAELYDDWDYHGIIYTIGKTLAWVIVVSVMAGWIYGLITNQV